jgi:hypothetical protein
MIICIGALFIAGCTSSVPVNGTAHPTAAPTPRPKLTATMISITAPTVTPEPTIINSIGNRSGWIQYTDYYNNFSVYKPLDWVILAVTPSNLTYMQETGEAEAALTKTEYEPASTYKQDMTWPASANTIYIISPDREEQIVINNEVELSAAINSTSTTEISDEIYDRYINEYKLAGRTTGSGNGLTGTIVSVQQDDNQYTMNGNPVRHVTFIVNVNGGPLFEEEAYLIGSGTTYYSEWCGPLGGGWNAGNLPQNTKTALTIMQSFTTTGES